MKKVLALTLAMLLCASMLAGCGKSEEEQQIEQQTTEQESADNTNGIGMTSEDCKGKVLAWNVGVDSASFDPANSISADSKSVINNTLEGLMRNTGEGAAPAMAQQMPEEKVNEDGTVTLTYTLREATWSDGQPVTAGDFAFAWKRCADPENQMSNAYLMSVLANYDDIAAGLADIEELGVKAVDDTTLEVTLSHTQPYFVQMTTFSPFYPVREDKVPTCLHAAARGRSGNRQQLVEGPAARRCQRSVCLCWLHRRQGTDSQEKRQLLEQGYCCDGLHRSADAGRADGSGGNSIRRYFDDSRYR